MHIPNHPKDPEKYLYISHGQMALNFFSVIAFSCLVLSSIHFFNTDPILRVFYPFLAFTVITYSVSMFVQGFGKEFDPKKHNSIIKDWTPSSYPSVDIFLPVCGEDIKIIHNTWKGVKTVVDSYKGSVTVYCLDDGDSAEVKKLAETFNFKYLVRDNRGHFKKAGNLKHGYINSNSEFITIFDADFKPRADFLEELLPYFYADPKLGIVQTPQYFDVHKNQNWLERGAGAVQEYFYRSVQQNRQSHNGAICVGSNAIYRRAALDSNGGTTLIEHSEDVHTGFDLRRNGWGLIYVPIVLAKGVCPNDLVSFFRQQYRWCMGSMSLLASKKFWQADIALRSRLCFITGFLHYIHTAVINIIAPLIPLSLLFIVPEHAKLSNYLLLVPAMLYSAVIFPLWHKTKYRSESFSIKMVYGWAHLFAIIDSLRGHGMSWHPTGSTGNKSLQYNLFRTLLVTYSLGCALVWVSAAFWYMIHWNFWSFAPVFITGIFYLLNVLRIVVTAFDIDKNFKVFINKQVARS